MGLVHVFLFLNVKDGPSRFRMASFYAVRLLMNSLLLLLFYVDLIACFVFHVQHRFMDLHAGQLHTHRFTLKLWDSCVVILTSASSAYVEVKLSAYD